MKTKDIHEASSNLNLQHENKGAILALIDMKTESDMEKILERIDAKFSAIDARFNSMDAKFNALNSKLNYLLWIVGALGALGTLMGASVTLLKLMGCASWHKLGRLLRVSWTVSN